MDKQQKVQSTARLLFKYIESPLRERRLRESVSSSKVSPSYMQKETWKRQYLRLKSFNNALSEQNTKLKTRNKQLENELAKVQTKYGKNPNVSMKEDKQSASLKGMVSCMRKEIDELTRENKKMKRSVKFTTASQMQLQMQQILKESQRICQLLLEERKINSNLKQQNQKITEQYTKIRHHNTSENIIKQQTSPRKIKLISNKQGLSKGRQKISYFPKTSKPEQHISINNVKTKVQCNQCKKLKDQIESLKTQGKRLCSQMQTLKMQKYKLRQQIQSKPIVSNRVIQDKIVVPTKIQIDKVRKFLVYRLKSLQIPQQQLISIFDKALRQYKQGLTIPDLVQIIISQPFSLVSDRNIEVLISSLCIGEPNINSQLTLDERKLINLQTVKQNFINFIGNYDLCYLDSLFIKSAQIITNNQQQLCRLGEGEKTISQQKLSSFLNELGIQKPCIQYIIIQLVGWSLDIDHLNLQEMFKLLCLPSVMKSSNQGLQEIQEEQEIMNLDLSKFYQSKTNFREI